MVIYPVLAREIAQRSIKKSDMAARLNISEKALYNKLSGATSFTWDEVCEITNLFFPDYTSRKDELFRKSEREQCPPIYISGRGYSQIVVSDNAGEVLAVVSGQEIIERDGCKVALDLA